MMHPLSIISLTVWALQSLFSPSPWGTDPQDPVKMLREHPEYAAQNLHRYEFHPVVETSAPRGFKPFYIYHYGRHGSRREGSASGEKYDSVIRMLEQADSMGILSPRGDSLLADMRFVRKTYNGMPMELLPVGQYEHRMIARRLYRRYPRVFKTAGEKVGVKSSDVARVLVSMACFTSELASLQPDLEFDINSGVTYYDTLYSTASNAHKAAVAQMLDGLLKTEPYDTVTIFGTLFTDASRGRKLVRDAGSLQRNIWEAASVAQAMGSESEMFRYLPESVVYRWWDYQNRTLYMRHGNSARFGYMRMPRGRLLIEDFINSADSAVKNGSVCADLRFGHDFPILAFTGFFGVDGVGRRLEFDEIPSRWCDPSNIPFASNMQWVFYRGKDDGPVLVKLVYNDRERSLSGDIKPYCGNYYDWNDIKTYVQSHMPVVKDEPGPLADEFEWEEIAPSMECSSLQTRLFDSIQSISVLRYDGSLYRTDIVNDSPMCCPVSFIASRYGALAAINGSYFSFKTLLPTTCVKDNGKTFGEPSRKLSGTRGTVLLVGEDGNVSIRAFMDSSLMSKAIEQSFEALEGGPLLLSGGHLPDALNENRSFYTTRHPRSIVGIKGKMVYLIVIDGRFPGCADGVTIVEAAQIAEMLGLSDAMNLDGGGSSALWAKGRNVLSHPCDNKRFDHDGQRAVPNAIVVKDAFFKENLLTLP